MFDTHPGCVVRTNSSSVRVGVVSICLYVKFVMSECRALVFGCPRVGGRVGGRLAIGTSRPLETAKRREAQAGRTDL